MTDVATDRTASEAAVRARLGAYRQQLDDLDRQHSLAIKRRDALIRTAHVRGGVPYSKIAAAAGLDKSWIGGIVNVPGGPLAVADVATPEAIRAAAEDTRAFDAARDRLIAERNAYLPSAVRPAGPLAQAEAARILDMTRANVSLVVKARSAALGDPLPESS